MKLRSATFCLLVALAFSKHSMGGQVKNAHAKGAENATSKPLPNKIIFQAFVVFDDTMRKLFKDTDEALQYALAFFNSLNFIFRHMERPQVKFEVVDFLHKDLPFREHALVLEGEEMNMRASVAKMGEYVNRNLRYKAADFVFLFTPRKLFTKKQDGTKEYERPQGLTWEKGICNSTRKVIIVRDVERRFTALSNAGFQLARLLGAPTTCTPDFWDLRPNYNLFHLSNCAQVMIREHLQSVNYDDPKGAKNCFWRKYTDSFHTSELPNSMIDEDNVCQKVEGMMEQYRRRGLCANNVDLSGHFENVYEYANSLGNTSRTAECLFDCCNTQMVGYFTVNYHLLSHKAFDGKPCANGQKVCVEGQCVENEVLEWIKPYSPEEEQQQQTNDE